tara:strand:+ start:483 stop:635 length:153 start_codon:yes stop_codon:yes gene_type:complete
MKRTFIATLIAASTPLTAFAGTAGDTDISAPIAGALLVAVFAIARNKQKK